MLCTRGVKNRPRRAGIAQTTIPVTLPSSDGLVRKKRPINFSLKQSTTFGFSRLAPQHLIKNHGGELPLQVQSTIDRTKWEQHFPPCL